MTGTISTEYDISCASTYIKQRIVDTGRLDAYVDQIKRRETDPYTVVSELMQEMLQS